MNLALNLIRTAELHPDNVAIRLDDTTLTYAELEEATHGLNSRVSSDRLL